MSLIRLENIKKKYHEGEENELEVLHGVGLNIEEGEFVSIVGESGSGKSTLMNIIGLLDRPNSGSYFLNGQDVSETTDNERSRIRNQQIGFVFQTYNLIPRTTAVSNVEVPMMYAGVPKRERTERAQWLLERVGMKERMQHRPEELSGGQKQRVAIARALAMEPEILLFDEPTSALDPTMVSEVLGVITRLAREGMTMIIVTHEMRFARQVSSRVLFFAEGVIYEEGTPEQLFHHPQRTLTQRFIRQIHETEFTIRSEHFDWYAMMAQMEQFCRQYNLSRQRTENVYRAVDESLAILGTAYAHAQTTAPTNTTQWAVGTCLTLSYTEQDDSLLLTVRTPHLIPSDALDIEDNMLAAAILRSVSTDIHIEKNALIITVR